MAYFLPTITSITPTFGLADTTITIIGTNFIVAISTTVKIGNNLATDVVINSNGDTITCKVPAGTGKQLVVVTTIYGPSTQQKYFTYADEIFTIEKITGYVTIVDGGAIINGKLYTLNEIKEQYESTLKTYRLTTYLIEGYSKLTTEGQIHTVFLNLLQFAVDNQSQPKGVTKTGSMIVSDSTGTLTYINNNNLQSVIGRGYTGIGSITFDIVNDLLYYVITLGNYSSIWVRPKFNGTNTLLLSNMGKNIQILYVDECLAIIDTDTNIIIIWSISIRQLIKTINLSSYGKILCVITHINKLYILINTTVYYLSTLNNNISIYKKINNNNYIGIMFINNKLYGILYNMGTVTANLII